MLCGLLYARKPTRQARLGSRAGHVGALGRLGTWPPSTVMFSKYLPNIHLEEETESCVGEGICEDCRLSSISPYAPKQKPGSDPCTAPQRPGGSTCASSRPWRALRDVERGWGWGLLFLPAGWSVGVGSDRVQQPFSLSA